MSASLLMSAKTVIHDFLMQSRVSQWLLYLYRLIGSQLIQPITHANWYKPRIRVAGHAQPVDITVNNCNGTVLSPQALSDAERYLFRHNTRAFLVMRQGGLVHESYRKFAANRTFNSMSMVKTVQALAIGIAIDRGMIRSVHDSVADYLPEWKNDRRASITIEHLLSMQSGLKSDLKLHGLTFLPLIVRLYLGTDINRHVLALPAVSEPGLYFEYNNYNTQLLGLILERTSGLTAAEFFSRYLWEPLGCHDASLWLDRHQGTARTFAAMFARPQDWLRIAGLFLNQGRYQGRQIVPAEWLEQMRVPRNTPERGVAGGKGDYGYQLWLKAHDYGLIRGIPSFEAMHAAGPHQDDSVFYFEGLRGQYVFVSPRHQLIMLRVGERPRKDWDAAYAINRLTGV